MDQQRYSRRDFISSYGYRRPGIRLEFARLRELRAGRRCAGLFLRAAFRRSLGLCESEGQSGDTRQPDARDRARSTRWSNEPDFVVFTGDLTQTTDDPKVRRATAARVSGNRRRAEGAAGAFLRRRARRVARSRRGLSGSLRWRAPLHVRSQGCALHRARQHFRPGAGARFHADRVAEGGLGAHLEGRAHRRADPSPALLAVSAVGLGHSRRRGGDRASDAVPECHRVLRPHSSRASPHAPATSRTTPRWR